MLTTQGDLVPAHLPDVGDFAFLPAPIQALFLWKIFRLDEEQSLMIIPEEFSHFLNPSLVIPNQIQVLLLDYLTILIGATSWSNVVKIVQTQRRECQIQLFVNWVSGGDPELERKIRMYMEPMHCVMFDQTQGVEREYHDKEPTGVPFLHLITIVNMSVMYWNSRGMGRNYFLCNIHLLIQQNQPRMIVISETRISRANIEKVMRNLPYDE